MIYDLFNLARADYVNYNLAFESTKFLSNENSYIVWKSFFNSLDYLNTRLQGHKVHDKFKKYVLDLIDDEFNKIDFEKENSKTEDQQHLLKKQLLSSWACKYQHEKCIDKSRELIKAYKSDDIQL